MVGERLEDSQIKIEKAVVSPLKPPVSPLAKTFKSSIVRVARAAMSAMQWPIQMTVPTVYCRFHFRPVHVVLRLVDFFVLFLATRFRESVFPRVTLFA